MDGILYFHKNVDISIMIFPSWYFHSNGVFKSHLCLQEPALTIFFFSVPVWDANGRSATKLGESPIGWHKKNTSGWSAWRCDVYIWIYRMYVSPQKIIRICWILVTPYIFLWNCSLKMQSFNSTYLIICTHVYIKRTVESWSWSPLPLLHRV